ncbi:MAG: ATP-binding cassette domain-containing protein [Actinomycetota bacterium]
MLRIDGLSKRFGEVQAVDHASLAVPTGRLVGFVGPNGAGKSTVMRSIFGLVEPDEGTIRWGDEPAVANTHRFGYMPEQRGLYPKMKIKEQVAYFARLKQVGKGEADRQARELLDALGLGDRLDDPLEKLSHGNQQRVQLAVAMVNDPELLVLDEPFNGLDPVALLTLQDVLEERTRAGAAVLFSSHQLDLVERLCDEVVLIAEGRVRRAGTVADVRASAGVHHLNIEVANPRERLDHALPRLLAGTGGQVIDGSASSALISLDTAADVSGLLPAVAALGRLRRFDYDHPSLEHVFTQLVTGIEPGTPTAELSANGDAR